MIDSVTHLNHKTKWFYLDLDKDIPLDSNNVKVISELFAEVPQEDATHILSATHINNKNSMVYSFIQKSPHVVNLIECKTLLVTPAEFDDDLNLLAILMRDVYKVGQREMQK